MSEEERKELARRISVEQAALDGKEIQCQWRGKSQWVDRLPVTCHFEWSEWDYRVKPDGFGKWWAQFPVLSDAYPSLRLVAGQYIDEAGARAAFEAGISTGREHK